MPLRSVIISGGGTGGHIYPALAIADEIKRRHPDCAIRFVGAMGRMEMEKVPAAGYPIDGLWITGIERKIFSKKNLLFPFRVISSLNKARRIVSAYRPDAVVGVGGFASGPLMYVASKRKIPTIIQEQNSYPGITNKILAKRADAICTGFPGMDRWFDPSRTHHTGNPLRGTISATLPSADEARKKIGLAPDRKTLFIMGGSLGALSINRAVEAALPQWQAKGYNVLWQTGKRFESELKAKYDGLENVVVTGFIQNMEEAYGAADLIVSRAGAMSISELAMVGKATLFVPSPHVAEDHQTWNARSVTDHGGAILLRDSDVVAQLAEASISLMEDPPRLAELGSKIRTFARPNAAAAVVDIIEKLCHD